jgi:hypothetical protein
VPIGRLLIEEEARLDEHGQTTAGPESTNSDVDGTDYAAERPKDGSIIVVLATDVGRIRNGDS